MRKILLFATICAMIVTALPVKAQEIGRQMGWIFHTDIVLKMAGNEIEYDANSSKYRGETFWADMFMKEDTIFLGIARGTSDKRFDSGLLFTVSNLNIDWISSQEGVRWEGIVRCKNIKKFSNIQLPLILELYGSAMSGNVSIRIGDNLHLCKNFQNYNMDLLIKHSQIKDNTTNSNNEKTVFHPQNAIVVDSEGSHNFTSYDCPNMNVTDNGNTVGISWGGDNVVLNESHSNSDTYTAIGNTSRGKVTIKAFRSSASGKIYLVTVAMPNPTLDVLHITINFKP